MPVIAGRNVNNNDLGVMVGGLIVLVFSFVTWFGTALNALTRNGWDSGIFSFLAVVLGIAAAVLVVLRVFTSVQLPRLQWGWNFIIFAAAAASAVLILLKLLFGYHLLGFGWHRSAGLYLSFLGALIETAFAYRAFKVSGETLPGGRRL
jgi:hypothetical protein